MAIRPFKRVAVTAATALSMTTLLATTAQAVPATLPHESMVTYTISPDGKVVAKADVKVNARAKDTVAPITLSGDADGVVVAAGKKTMPANYKILRAQPGYNPYQHPAPHGEDPDSEDLDLKQGFTADQLLTLYQADIPENISYTNVISGINEALKHPEVSQKNAALVLAINNNATPAQIQRALEDSNEENLSTMSDALGTHLGKIYYDLYKDGKLVKLQQLVGGNMSRGFNFTNATLIEKVSYNLKRPFYTFLRTSSTTPRMRTTSSRMTATRVLPFPTHPATPTGLTSRASSWLRCSPSSLRRLWLVLPRWATTVW